MDKENIIELKKKLTEISDILYKGNVTQGIADINNVIPDIAVLASWLPDDESREELINNALSPLLEAMEQGDPIATADIIVYELIAVMDKMI